MQTNTMPTQDSPTRAYESPASAEDALMGTLMALGRRMRTRAEGDTLDYSLFPVLKVLGTCGSVRLSSLATMLELDASTVSRHVKHLEDKGLLERTSDPDDGRASRIAVTDAGRETVHEHFSRRKALINAALEGFSDDERESLRSLLDKFNRELVQSDDKTSGSLDRPQGKTDDQNNKEMSNS